MDAFILLVCPFVSHKWGQNVNKAARLCSYNKDGKQRRRELTRSVVSQQCAIQKISGALMCTVFGGIAK